MANSRARNELKQSGAAIFLEAALARGEEPVGETVTPPLSADDRKVVEATHSRERPGGWLVLGVMLASVPGIPATFVAVGLGWGWLLGAAAAAAWPVLGLTIFILGCVVQPVRGRRRQRRHLAQLSPMDAEAEREILARFGRRQLELAAGDVETARLQQEADRQAAVLRSAEAQEAEQQRQEGIQRVWANRLAERQAEEAAPGVQKLLVALQALPVSRLYRHLPDEVRDVFVSAGTMLLDDEEVLGIAFGQRGVHLDVIAVTAARIFVIHCPVTSDAYIRHVYSRTDGVTLTGAQTMTDGQIMMLRAESGDFARGKWTRVHPPGGAAFLARSWRTGSAQAGVSRGATCKATYLGGTFVGNLVPRTGQTRPLQPNASVVLMWDDAQMTVQLLDRVIGRYQVTTATMTVESASSVVRSVSVKRLLGTAAAASVVGVFAGPLLKGSVRPAHRESFVLCLEDGDDGGVFQLDVAFGRSLAQVLKTAPAGEQQGDLVETVERLSALKAAGALSDTEFERLKAHALGRPENATTGDPGRDAGVEAASPGDTNA